MNINQSVMPVGAVMPTLMQQVMIILLAITIAAPLIHALTLLRV